MTMRFPLAIAACVGFALATLSIAGPASAQSQDGSYQSASRMLDLRGDSAVRSGSGPRILRGSTAQQATAAQPRQGGLLGPGRYQTVAGEKFWLVDQQTGELVSCRNIGTANVGDRQIQCAFGTFSRYSRGFGNNFQH
jgi:hypothetical protein